MADVSTDSTDHRPLYSRPNLLIIFSVTLMAIMGVSSITPAFPEMIKDLGISTHTVGLLITAFTLPGVVLTPVLGVLADQWGRRRILIPALVLFGIAGFLCTFARNFHLLLLLRFFQGIGGASLNSLNVTIIGDLYSGHERATAMGYNASILSIGTGSYPIVGGALAILGWYYPFVLPILAIPVALLVLFGLHNPEPRREQSLRKYLSLAWHSMANARVLVLFGASIMAFIMLYGSYLNYFPILVGNHFGESAFIIGLIMSSMSFTTALVSSRMGRLTRRFGSRRLLIAAFVFYGAGLFLMPLMPKVWMLLLPTILFGTGHGLNIPNVQTLLADAAPMEQRGVVMSFNGMVYRLGQTLGPVFMGLLFAQWGLGATFTGGGFIAVVMIFVVAALLR